MSDHILTVTGLTKRFGGVVATDNMNFVVKRGETHALIGPNGAGKTTLIAQLQGELRPDAGSIFYEDTNITYMRAYQRANVGIARSFQITSVFPGFTAIENVRLAVQSRLGHSFHFFRDVAADTELVRESRHALEMIGLSHRANTIASELSHGERRQLELAMVLALKPRLLLLDEPMAGMGRQDSIRMTEILRNLKEFYSMLLVEHDMDAVFTLADTVTVLLGGRTIATDVPDVIRNNPQVKAAYLGNRK